ncbi:MAG: serine/threonine protein kinase [Polyangiaceae bacterium]|jgi:serine/threonine-protein kinase|nr:serine/threonine protein kinase [Polyangiaceae bacterium]
MTHLKAGDVIAKRYHVSRLVGVGGMGSVYESNDAVTGERRAIKVLHRHLHSHPVIPKRFVREAQAARALSTPHAVKVDATGQLDDGLPYIVMEYLDGTSLQQIVRGEVGRVESERVLYLADQIAVAIDEAHSRGIVHRDLKPENIFVLQTVHGEFVKVVDFGISKTCAADDGAKLTQTGMTLGTPQYMPLEQLRGTRDLDGRVDVYALGVILFELFAGVRPYDGSTYEQVILRVATTTAPSLGHYRKDLPPGLVQVVDRALARDRDARIGSMMELRLALSPFWSGRSPVGAAASGAYPRLDRPAQQVPATLRATAAADSAVCGSAPTLPMTVSVAVGSPGWPAGRAAAQRQSVKAWLVILMITIALGIGLTALIVAAGLWWYLAGSKAGG